MRHGHFTIVFYGIAFIHKGIGALMTSYVDDSYLKKHTYINKTHILLTHIQGSINCSLVMR